MDEPLSPPLPAELRRLADDDSDGSDLLERICLRLKNVTAMDFSHFKHATLARRIERRMNLVELLDLGEYVKRLEQSPDEAEALGKDLLISVTKFFRDPEAFRELVGCIEGLFERAAPRRRVRLWSAGCATGEEAYTLAMICESIRQRSYPEVAVTVFATDVDREALAVARTGIYPRHIAADLPDGYVEKFLVAEGNDRFRVAQPLRDLLVFSRHDLMADPPLGEIDLVSCRNLLIYLRPAAQRRVLALLHGALRTNGLLFLGCSEALGELAYAFEILDKKNRIFRKAQGSPLRPGDAIPNLPGNLPITRIP